MELFLLRCVLDCSVSLVADFCEACTTVVWRMLQQRECLEIMVLRLSPRDPYLAGVPQLKSVLTRRDVRVRSLRLQSRCSLLGRLLRIYFAHTISCLFCLPVNCDAFKLLSLPLVSSERVSSSDMALLYYSPS